MRVEGVHDGPAEAGEAPERAHVGRTHDPAVEGDGEVAGQVGGVDQLHVPVVVRGGEVRDAADEAAAVRACALGDDGDGGGVGVLHGGGSIAERRACRKCKRFANSAIARGRAVRYTFHGPGACPARIDRRMKENA